MCACTFSLLFGAILLFQFFFIFDSLYIYKYIIILAANHSFSSESLLCSASSHSDYSIRGNDITDIHCYWLLRKGWGLWAPPSSICNGKLEGPILCRCFLAGRCSWLRSQRHILMVAFCDTLFLHPRKVLNLKWLSI